MNSTTLLMDRTYDALVVGARVAGAATAMLLARQGMRVLAIDRAAPGTDITSTHALMRGGVLQLRRWGLERALINRGTVPIRETTFHYGDDVRRVEIRPKHGVEALLAPRRTTLDPLLVEAARDAGAHVRHNVSFVGINCDGSGRVGGADLVDADGRPIRINAGIVIGADGARSRVAQAVEAPTLARSSHVTASLYAYFDGPFPPGYQWHYAETAAAGTIPTEADSTCIFVSATPRRMRQATRKGTRPAFFELLEEASPSIAEMLRRDTRSSSRVRGFGGLRGHMRQAWGPGWALVGDAGYFKDPLTAHGMTDALRDAELLARGIESNGFDDLEEYQAQRDFLSRRFFELTDDVASFEWTLPELSEIHVAMSREMVAEARYIAQLDEPELTLATGT